MKTGLVISGAAHAGALVLALFSFSAPRPLDAVPMTAVPVELVSVESVTKVMQGERDAKPADKPAPKKAAVDTPKPAPGKPSPKPPVEKAAAPKPAPAPEPPPAPEPQSKPEPKPVETAALPKPVTTTPVRPKPTPPQAKPEPKPEPKPTDVKPAVADTPDVPAIEPTPEPEKSEPKETLPTNVATPKSRPRPPRPAKPVQKAKPEPEVRTAKADAKPRKVEKASTTKAEDASALEQAKALLDKRKATGGAKKSTQTASLGTAKGTALKMSASELDALRAQIRGCWNVQGGGADADSLRATVSFKLDRAGNIVSDPVAGGEGGDSARARRAFARSALRAVKRCAPYKLPAEKYETWADVTVNFSLADML